MKNMTFLFSFLLMVTPCSAATITVNWDGSGDHTTIQAGINAAVSGQDTIVVAEGTYVENVSFGGKDIIVKSTDPDEPNVVADTIIDGDGVDTVVRFNGTETSTCKLSGFTITNGYGPADADGGGITGAENSATVANCIIRDNIAQRHGGGIRNVNGLIDRCIITGNSTVNRNGGGMVSCQGTISNCLIYNNTATLAGGGMVNCDGDIVNCTVVNNTAGNGTGGIAACDGTITNCIIWDNAGTVSDQITDSSTPTYSCIQNWSTGGTGNIATDPEFADPCSPDYHLLHNSPCIDAGDNNAVASWIYAELDGNARFHDDPNTSDTGNGSPPIVDIGAYEFTPVPNTEPLIQLFPSHLEFSARQDSPNPEPQIFTVRNGWGDVLNWDLTETCDWLTANPTSGSSTGDANDVTINVDISGLGWGEYNCQLTVSDPCAVNSPQHVNVTLYNKPSLPLPPGVFFYDDFRTSILDPTNWTNTIGEPTIDSVGISEPSEPYSLRLNYYPDGGEEIESCLINLEGLSNIGMIYWYERTGGGESPDCGEDLVIEYWNGSDWSELDRQFGSCFGGQNDMFRYVESVISLPSGAMHSGFKFRVSSTDPWDTIGDWFVDDILIADLVDPPPIIGLSSSDFTFFALEDASNPYDQTLTIHNSGGGTLNWELTETCDWLTANLGSGSSTGEPNDVTLSVDISGLAIGEYNCQLLVSDANAANSPLSVDILLNIFDPASLQPLGLDYVAEAYACAEAIVYAYNPPIPYHDDDEWWNNTVNGKAMVSVTSQVYVGDVCWQIIQDSSMESSIEGLYVDFHKKQLVSSMHGWGHYLDEYYCPPEYKEEGPYGGFGNGYTTMEGLITIGIFEGYPVGSSGLTLRMDAQITGDSPASWDTWDWWLKIWCDDPCSPLAILDDGNLSVDLPVLAGEILNIEFYHEVAEESDWPTGGTASIVDVDIKVCPPNIADIDENCSVNLDDVLIMALQWLDTPSEPSADIAPDPLDNFVDYQDFTVIQQNWQWPQ